MRKVKLYAGFDALTRSPTAFVRLNVALIFTVTGVQIMNLRFFRIHALPTPILTIDATSDPLEYSTARVSVQ